jgi:hypothetical protein
MGSCLYYDILAYFDGHSARGFIPRTFRASLAPSRACIRLLFLRGFLTPHPGWMIQLSFRAGV